MSEFYSQLESVYGEYLRDITRVTAGQHNLRGAFSRIFGGSAGGPGSDSCNDRFAEGVKALVDRMTQETPASSDAAEVIGYVISAHRKHDCPQAASLMMQAVHGYMLPLTEWLTSADAEGLCAEYSRILSGTAPLPVQKQLADALRKRAEQSD